MEPRMRAVGLRRYGPPELLETLEVERPEPAPDGRLIRVAAAWEARFSGKTMEVRLDAFEPPGARLGNLLEERFGEVAAFLGARDVRFT